MIEVTTPMKETVYFVEFSHLENKNLKRLALLHFGLQESKSGHKSWQKDGNRIFILKCTNEEFTINGVFARNIWQWM